MLKLFKRLFWFLTGRWKKIDAPCNYCGHPCEPMIWTRWSPTTSWCYYCNHCSAVGPHANTKKQALKKLLDGKRVNAW